MTDIFKYLLKSFVLLRDLVGYLIPGLVFLALIDPDRFWTLAGSNPGWIFVAVVLLASYVIAQLLAAVGYALLNLHFGKPKGDSPETRLAALKDKLYYATYYPDVFIEANRQDTVHLMRIATSMALVLAGTTQIFLIFYGRIRTHGEEPVFLLPLVSWTICVIAGILLFLNSRSGDAHNRETMLAAVAAAKDAEQKGRKPAE